MNKVNEIDANRFTFCAQLFFGVMELLAFGFVMIMASWYAQSKQPVLDFADNPGYRIIEVTDSYIEVKWVDVKLVLDCPGRVEPMFVGEFASQALDSYPFIVSSERKTFTRRYAIPTQFPYGDYQLRINMIGKCNPVFETRQVLIVPFRYDPKNLSSY